MDLQRMGQNGYSMRLRIILPLEFVLHVPQTHNAC